MKQYGYAVYCDGALILMTEDAEEARAYWNKHPSGPIRPDIPCPCMWARYVKKVPIAEYFDTRHTAPTKQEFPQESP